jgi:FkbM family methyltransferase
MDLINRGLRLLRQKGLLPYPNQASRKDLAYCFRLLMGEKPDKVSWDNWYSLVKTHGLDVQALVDLMMASAEYRRAREKALRPSLVELDTFKIFVRKSDFFIGRAIAEQKNYEPHVSRLIQQMLHRDDYFVDIGANIGYFTLMAAAIVGPEGRVFAFEPNHNNCALIERSIAVNGFDNIRLFPYAAAEKNQVFLLWAAELNSNGTLAEFDPEVATNLSSLQEVQAVAADEALAGISKIDVIKMDIEGAEPRAWQGMLRLVRKHRPVIILEFSPDLILETSHLEAAVFYEMIRKEGYDLFLLDPILGIGKRPVTREQIDKRREELQSTHVDLVARPVVAPE